MTDYNLARLVGHLPSWTDADLRRIRLAAHEELERRRPQSGRPARGTPKRPTKLHLAHYQSTGYGPVPRCGKGDRVTHEGDLVTCKLCLRIAG